MFRPIRNDTPKGKAALKFKGGLALAFLVAPLNAASIAFNAMDQDQPILEIGHNAGEIIPPVVFIPSIMLILGLMLAYDGWWHLRQIERQEGN